MLNIIWFCSPAFGLQEIAQQGCPQLTLSQRNGCKRRAPVLRDAELRSPVEQQPRDAPVPARDCQRHDLVVRIVARNELCRRFMAIPGVGPVTAPSFMMAIDDLSCFRGSRDVAACFGVTLRRWQSGTAIDVQGRISKAGDADVRRALY